MKKINLGGNYSGGTEYRYPNCIALCETMAQNSFSKLIPLLHKCRGEKELRHLLAPMIVLGLFKDSLVTREVVSWCSTGRIEMLQYAVLLLKQVDYTQPFLWNMVLRGYEQRNDQWKAIQLFYQMLFSFVIPDKFSFPFVLKACANARALKEGEKIHCRVMKSPKSMDLFVQDSLIFMYAKCGQINAARISFDTMPNKSLISWNSMIDGYVKQGDVSAAFKLFDSMPERDLFSWNVMIDGLGKRGLIDVARQLFDEMPERDAVSWNSMIDGYAKCGRMEDARTLFAEAPNKDVFTWSIMLNGFVECGKIEIAHNWFEKIPCKNIVTWNSLINGYAKHGNLAASRKLFELMPYRNLNSWNVILDALTKNGEIELACKIFNEMPTQDIFSWNTIIDGHAKLGKMNVAQELFDIMPIKDLVSWNAIITGYRQNGHAMEAIQMFTKMHLDGQKPNSLTLATVLSATADLGFLVQGRSVHAYIDRNQFPLDGIVGAALIDMYSKCGYVHMAKGIFNSITSKSIDHWNAILSGFAIHGYGSIAVSLFDVMEESPVQPDDITFISVLSACSHAGLLHAGHQYFEVMRLKYRITPKIQHYGCMVDLLGRSGHLEEAFSLVRNMPMRANDVVWRALLGAAKNHGNIEIAECAARHLTELVPHDSSSYVLLSNIYGCIGQCESARDMWKIMKERGIAKTPGCSFIELKGILHEFTAGDTSHPAAMDIYLLLSNLTHGLMLAGYVPDLKHSLC